MPATAQTIFDLFEYKKIETFTSGKNSKPDFAINFPAVEAGWLEVKLRVPGKNFTYNTTNCCGYDGLRPLLKATIDLLEYIGEKDKYFGTLRSHTRVIHCTEPTEYVWDLQRHGSRLRVLLRENPNLAYELDRFYYKLPDLELEYPEMTDNKLKNSLVFAVEIGIEQFMENLYIACRKFLVKTGAETFKKEWKSEFPVDLLNRLEQWIMLELPEQNGLWYFTGSDYSNRVSNFDDPVTFKVEGRRMATDTELRKIGLV